MLQLTIKLNLLVVGKLEIDFFYVAVIQDEVLHPDRKVLIFMNSAESVNVLYRNLINYMKQSRCKSVKDLARKVYRLSGSLTREVMTDITIRTLWV